MIVLTDQNYREAIAHYVARMTERAPNYGDFVAIGLVNEQAEIMAGAVFCGYSHPNILMHIAAERLTPTFVAAIMRYPFLQLNCSRITGLIDKKNAKSREFAKHLGASLEGVMRKAGPRGDVCVYGLLRKEAEKWLEQRYQARLEPARWLEAA